jgi:hypothetical protein
MLHPAVHEYLAALDAAMLATEEMPPGPERDARLRILEVLILEMLAKISHRRRSLRH